MVIRTMSRPVLAALVVLSAGSPGLASDVDAYVDEFAGFDVGESPRYATEEQSPLYIHTTEPIISGLLVGQFEKGGLWTLAQINAGTDDWKWGILDTDSMTFVQNGNGETFFNPPDPNFTAVVQDDLNGDGQPDTSLLRYQVDISSAGPGYQLEPDHTYAIFAVLGYKNFMGGSSVPNEAPGGPSPQLQVSLNAAVAGNGEPNPFSDQLNDPWPIGFNAPGVLILQLATSAMIHLTSEELVDCNLNSIPDLAEVRGDLDGSGQVDPLDAPLFVDALLHQTLPGDCLADMNEDGLTNGLDIQAFVNDVLVP